VFGCCSYIFDNSAALAERFGVHNGANVAVFAEMLAETFMTDTANVVTRLGFLLALM